MHIGEGVLTATRAGQGVLLAGTVAAAAGTMIGLRRLDEDQIPKAAVLGSAFFVASAIQFPMGPTSVHLVLSGLMGLVLGWSIFPAVLVGLTLQFAFFSIGGPTVLGLNTLIMALPGLICYYLFRVPIGSSRQPVVFAAGFAAGSIAVILGALLSAAASSWRASRSSCPALGFLALHVPVALSRRHGDRKRGCLAAAGSAGSAPRDGVGSHAARGRRWVAASHVSGRRCAVCCC